MSADMHGARADARKRAVEAGSTPDDRDVSRDALELAVATAIRDERRHRWEPVHEGECIIDARAAIQAVLTSDWLAEHDRKVAAKALRDAATQARSDAEACPEGCATTRCRAANLVTAAWLDGRADRIEGDS